MYSVTEHGINHMNTKVWIHLPIHFEKIGVCKLLTFWLYVQLQIPKKLELAVLKEIKTYKDLPM